jgi:DtxR family Mn-dependent transcriptional regulator
MDYRITYQVRPEALSESPGERLSPAWEDYLKAIFEITSDKARATTNEIAAQMEVAPASATVMVQKMAAFQPPLLDYQKHQGVTLTPAGRMIALEVIRHHRLLETFLQKVLGYSWDEVHLEADRLEHVITEEFEERIAQVLGNPAVDPHGEPIPGKDLHMDTAELRPLSALRLGDRALVIKVKPKEGDLLRYLSQIGLVLDAQVIITGYSAFDGNLTLRIDDNPQPFTLGERITSRVFVMLLG